MPLSTIAINGSKSLQRGLLLAPEVTFNGDSLALNYLRDLYQLIL